MKQAAIEETRYKIHIVPKKWVPHSEAEQAKALYAIISRTNPVAAKALEVFVTNPDLQKFWQKVSKHGELKQKSYCVGTLYNEMASFALRKPSSTEAQMDENIRKASAHLRAFSKMIKSDPGLQIFSEFVFGESIAKHVVPLRQGPQSGTARKLTDSSITSFLDSFATALSDPKNRKRLNPHADFPKSIGDEKKAERVFLAHSVSKIVRVIYGKPNHAMAARILDKIRPDLAPFSADNIRQISKPMKKPKQTRK